MADKQQFHNRSKEDLEQIHRDTERESRVEPGPGKTTNRSDVEAAEGLQTSEEVERNYQEALDIGAEQKGEGRVVDR